MPYDKLLKKFIKEKHNLKYTEVAEKCNAIDKDSNISSNYIKQLANGLRPAPSEKKSRLIAKALEEDEHLLVLEGYIDKAPREIIELLNKLREYCSLAVLASFKNVVTQENFNVIKEELSKESLAQFFADFFDNNDKLNFINNKNFSIKRDYLDFSISSENISFIEVTDNSMYPKIEKGSKVILEVKDTYINGEILALKIKYTNEILYRLVVFNKDTVILTPLNPEFSTITYNRCDIDILGKVSQKVTDL